MLYQFDGTLFFDADNERHAFQRLAEHFASLALDGSGIEMKEGSQAYVQQAEHVEVFEQTDATGNEQ